VNGRERRRGVRLLALLAVVTVGLGSRSQAVWIPTFVASHAGDALYATAAYLALSLAAPRLAMRAAFLAALAFCLLIEGSQAVEHPILAWLRGLPGGRLVLGQGFDPADPGRYFVGALAGVAIDRALPWRRLPSSTATD
jgi:hypothetical protein